MRLLTRKEVGYVLVDVGVMLFIAVLCISLCSKFTLGGLAACFIAQVLFWLVFKK